MPLYSYQCKSCQHEFETLVSGSDQAACPECNGQDLQRLVALVAKQGTLNSTLRQVRAKAASEGHFSNYSKAETKGKY